MLSLLRESDPPVGLLQFFSISQLQVSLLVVLELIEFTGRTPSTDVTKEERRALLIQNVFEACFLQPILQEDSGDSSSNLTGSALLDLTQTVLDTAGYVRTHMFQICSFWFRSTSYHIECFGRVLLRSIRRKCAKFRPAMSELVALVDSILLAPCEKSPTGPSFTPSASALLFLLSLMGPMNPDNLGPISAKFALVFKTLHNVMTCGVQGAAPFYFHNNNSPLKVCQECTQVSQNGSWSSFAGAVLYAHLSTHGSQPTLSVSFLIILF
jgi:hypothetical protein